MSEATGHFRLIQKTDEDVLGTVHCAAWKVPDESEEIVLVRLFDRDGIDPVRYLEQVTCRQSLVGTKISNQLMTSRQLGVVESQAFDLLPYASGQSLASLISQATGHRETFPLPVALFIVGRVAAGLSAAFHHGLDGENILHGFVTPQLIRVSEEGRVALCGLETSPALRGFRGTAATFAKILPYLSPESVAGEDLHRSDDVYSLGVVLYELLTLRPLASPADLRLENPKIPAELRYFLDRSVAPRFRRIQSVVQWIQEFKTLVIKQGWTSSAQKLSAFIAGIDERLHPLKPDTSEITATDREALAQAIRTARRQQDESQDFEPDDTKSLTTAAGAEESDTQVIDVGELQIEAPQPHSTSPSLAERTETHQAPFQTMAISRDILESSADENDPVTSAETLSASDSSAL